MNKKICFVTGTRAEYGLLQLLMKSVNEDPDFQLQIIATGMHLSPEFGLTFEEIEKDGFIINEKIEMLLSSDTVVGITKSIGLATIGFADAFNRLKPDLLIILGDRYEILAAAQSALIAKIPIAHIAGGDTTEGAFDEAIRHCITKMSHIHFVTNKQSAERVYQLGENPKYIFDVGSPGIDQIKQLKLLSIKELEQSINFKFRQKNVLVTFHPVTLELETSSTQFQELIKALENLGNDVGIIITKCNADTDGRVINTMIDHFVSKHENAVAFTSLGQLRYLSAIKYVDVVVGNSSSGLYEVPSFGKPTVNIGDRQKGRLQASSVLNCRPIQAEITNAILTAFENDYSSAVNPYGKGDSVEKIMSILKKVSNYKDLLQKHFFRVSLKDGKQ